MFEAYSFQKGFKKNRLTVFKEIERRTGIVSDFIKNKPDCPGCFIYIWNTYNQILNGCDKVTYLNIDAYSRLCKSDLSKNEVDILIEIELIRVKNNAN